MKKFTIKNFFFLLGMMLFASTMSAQTTHYVKGDVMGGDGSSWAMAFQYLDDALAGAQDGDQIWVAAGTYIPGGTAPKRDTSFNLKNGVNVYGGFAGNETMLSERDFGANATILSGDIDGDDGPDDFFSAARFANAFNVVRVDSTVADAILDGFTITNGHTDTAAMADNLRGGGLSIFGSPTVRNCIIENNYANLGGGAYPRTLDASGTTFEDCTFRNNRALNGGALRIAGVDDVVITGCDFTNNRADGSAGAILPSDGIGLAVTDCNFEGNACSGQGGAMYPINMSDMTFTNVVFKKNTTPGNGGAMRADNSLFTMDNVSIDSNDATGFGGGVIFLSCDFTMSNSLVNANVTGTGGGEGGGGMYCGAFGGESSTYTVQNTTVSLNDGPFGGGIAAYNENSVGTFVDCTFSGNTATTAGAAISISFSGGAVLVDCEFNGNSTQAGGAIFSSRDGSSLTATNSLFSGNTATTFGGGALYLAANGTHILNDCSFENNLSTAGFGGALSYLPDSFPTNLLVIDACLFQNNNGFDQGGALNINDGDVRIGNSLFNFNKATDDPMSGDIAGRGGFLANNCGAGDTSRVRLFYSTIANSDGSFAAGISQWESDTTMANTSAAIVEMGNNAFFTPYGENYNIEAGRPEVISLGGNCVTGASLAQYLTGTNDATGVQDFGFTDEYAETDFTLTDMSVLRGKAVPVTDDELDLTVDINGETRDAMSDVGAYEFDDPIVSTRPEIGDANSLQVQPNPAESYTQLTLTNDFNGEVQVRVSNVLGQLVRSTVLDKNTTELQYQLNVADLTPGLYEVSLQFNNKVVTRKLIKQ